MHVMSIVIQQTFVEALYICQFLFATTVLFGGHLLMLLCVEHDCSSQPFVVVVEITFEE